MPFQDQFYDFNCDVLEFTVCIHQTPTDTADGGASEFISRVIRCDQTINRCGQKV